MNAKQILVQKPNTRPRQGDQQVSAGRIFETDSVTVGNEVNKLQVVF